MYFCSMNARRDKAKQQKTEQNIKPETAVEAKKSFDEVDKSRKEKLSNYLIDISKYVMTGVVIASLFKDLDNNRLLIYMVGLFVAFTALGVGLVLTDKKKGK